MTYLLESLLLGLALAMDATAVALVCGTQLGRITPKHILSMALPFGLAQFLMPLIGWGVGSIVASWFAAIDHWIAFGILAAIGIKFIIDSQKPGACPLLKQSLLVVLSASLATSLDALVVGFSFALIRRPILLTATLIGLVTILCTSLALMLGQRLGEKYGARIQILGGITLIGIGVHVLLSHLL